MAIITLQLGLRPLKSTSNDRSFWETFSWQSYCFYSQSLCQKSAERNRRRNNCFHISFWCLTWYMNPGFTSNKPTHYLLDYGDLCHHIFVMSSFSIKLWKNCSIFFRNGIRALPRSYSCRSIPLSISFDRTIFVALSSVFHHIAAMAPIILYFNPL